MLYVEALTRAKSQLSSLFSNGFSRRDWPVGNIKKYKHERSSCLQRACADRSDLRELAAGSAGLELDRALELAKLRGLACKEDGSGSDCFWRYLLFPLSSDRPVGMVSAPGLLEGQFKSVPAKPTS